MLCFTMFKDGKGLLFDDEVDYTILNLDADGCWKDLATCTNGLTVCLWMSASASSSGFKTIMSSVADATHDHGIIFVVDNIPDLLLRLRTKTHTHLIRFIPYSSNDWIYFCLTWQPGTSELKAYVNGTNVVGTPSFSTGTFTAATANFALGDEYVNSAPTPNKGAIFKVDDFALWDQALSPSAISQIYSSYSF